VTATASPSAVPPRARSRRRVLVLALVAGALAVSMAYAGVAVAGSRAPEPLGPGVVTVPVTIEHSAFSIDTLHVRPGTVVRFVVDNRDPIHHELVVGPRIVHAQHETGSERVHPPVPGEVSVGPHEAATTFYVFADPGPVAFACHLPGHVAYGMTGTVEVAP
jgi:uncharacterized cupredoxin-like copper-binding protein